MDRSSLEFAHLASERLRFEVGDKVIVLVPKVFKSGSLGWQGQDKAIVNGTKCQVNFLITVIKSKPVEEAGRVQEGQSKPPVLMPGEQNGTMPEKGPETPQDLFDPKKGQEPPKRLRKRSRASQGGS